MNILFWKSKGILQDKRGSTSVLVIFMMIVLVTLGAFSISAAHANYVLGEKAKSWNVSYYSVEKLGEQFLADVDGQLLLAERQMVEYMKNGGVSTSEQGNEYLVFAKKNIDTLKQKYDGLNSFIADENGEQYIKITMNFKLQDKDFMLLVELRVNPIDYIFLNSNVYPVNNSAKKRYDILTWKQWQQPFELEQPIEFWNGMAPE